MVRANYLIIVTYLNKKMTITSEKIEQSCYNEHICSDCGKKLHPNRWWHYIIVYIPVLIVLGIMWSGILIVSTDNCYVKEYYWGTKYGDKEVVKTFDIPCNELK